MHLLFESSSDEVETDICWFLVFKLKRQSSTHRVTKNFFSKIYFGADFPELLKMIGVEYKLDYNSRASGTFS